MLHPLVGAVNSKSKAVLSSLGSNVETSVWEAGGKTPGAFDHFIIIISSKPCQVGVNGGFARVQAFQLP